MYLDTGKGAGTLTQKPGRNPGGKGCKMGSEDRRYNGWTNYETWLCALWLDNEQCDYRYWTGVAQSNYDLATASKIFTREEHATTELAALLKSHHEESADHLTGITGFWADLIGAALSEVNWREIAEHYIDNTRKEEEVA